MVGGLVGALVSSLVGSLVIALLAWLGRMFLGAVCFVRLFACLLGRVIDW